MIAYRCKMHIGVIDIEVPDKIQGKGEVGDGNADHYPTIVEGSFCRDTVDS